jgi:hypothetical protein
LDRKPSASFAVLFIHDIHGKSSTTWNNLQDMLAKSQGFFITGFLIIESMEKNPNHFEGRPVPDYLR